MTRVVDWASWPRREVYEFFSPMSQPFFSVTFKQDVTRLRQFAGEHKLSFYYSLVYLCTQALNQVEAFRYALRNGDLVLFDQRIPSFTDLKPGESLISHFGIEGDAGCPVAVRRPYGVDLVPVYKPLLLCHFHIPL